MFRRTSIFAIAFALLCQQLALGAVARSMFTSGPNGWTLSGQGTLSQYATGVRGAMLQCEDLTDEPELDPDEAWVVAPAWYLGDWSDLDGTGELSWDQVILDAGDGAVTLAAKVEISGSGVTATWESGNYITATVQSFSVPIEETSWTVTGGTWATLIANVTDLRIRIDSVLNTAGTDLDISAIDNVVLATAGQTIYVDLIAAGNATGTSWDDAFKYLEDALAGAKSGDEVWVAGGTYTPAGVGGDRGRHFSLLDGVKLYGGFEGGSSEKYVGGESTLGQRDTAANEAILSADLNFDDAPGFTNIADNSYHVLLGDNVGSTCAIDGFTIRGGNANGVGLNERGGGLYLLNQSTPVITNCRFENNWAVYGGGLSCWNTSAALVKNCVFSGNGAEHGGGLYCSNTSPTLISCRFTGNSGDFGGGLNCYESHPDLINCLFDGNTATDYGGAVRLYNLSQPWFYNCTLADNSAGTEGGAIAGTEATAVYLLNSIVWGNDVNGNEQHDSAAFDRRFQDPYQVDYSCIQGGLDDFPLAVGSISTDPLFDGVEYRLGPFSPCIDAASNDEVPADTHDLDGDLDTSEPVPLDIENFSRFYDEPNSPDVGAGTPPIVDMGAYETPELQMFLVTGDDPVVVLEGATGTFSVTLALDPGVGNTITATVAWADGDADLFVQAGATLEFTSDDVPAGTGWNVPHVVTLGAAEDADYLPGSATFEVSAPTVRATTVNAVEDDNEPVPDRLYVDANAPGLNIGTSWEDAYTELRDALASLEFRFVDEIWVADGSYTPSATGDRDATFQLVNGVSIYGGFAGYDAQTGGETSLSQRDLAANDSVLSGDLLGNDGTVDWENYDENSYHVVTANGVDATAVLDGLVISGGYGNGGDIYDQRGAAMMCDHGAPTVRYCRFENNYVISDGGAVYVIGGVSSFQMIHCVFRGNYAGYGGAMNIYGNSSLGYPFPTLVGCLFNGNTAKYRGGALRNYRTHPNLINCAFIHNVAEQRGGGGIDQYGQAAYMQSCVLWGNLAGDEPDEYTVEQQQIYVSGFTGLNEIHYSCIEGWAGGLAGTGNHGLDPKFEDMDGADDIAGTADDNIRLREGSPCIDAGNNVALGDPVIITTDLDGNPRFLDDRTVEDLGVPTVAIPEVVDMGPYEAPLRQGTVVEGLPLIVPEGGTTSFTVSLAMNPEDMDPPLSTLDVLVTVTSGDVDITIQSGALLTFDGLDWMDPQTVVVAGAEDVDFSNGQANIEVAIDLTPPKTKDLTAVEVDNDGVPSIVYVDKNASGADNGLNWTDAFHELRMALAVLEDREAVAEIWVADGVYQPAGLFGDRAARFTLVSGMGIYGGFEGEDSVGYPGGETLREQRNPLVNASVLSGDLGQNDTGPLVNDGDNSFHVVDISGTDNTAVLDGFTVRAGIATGVAPDNTGAGIYCADGSATLRNLKIVANYCTGSGAGLVVTGATSDLTIENCLFLGNFAWYGAAAYCSDDTTTAWLNCGFVDNNTWEQGGAVRFLRGGSQAFYNCTFYKNSARKNGGGIYAYQSEVVMANCIFWENRVNRKALPDLYTQIEVVNSLEPVASYCCIQGWEGQWASASGIIADEPVFWDVDGPDDELGTVDDNLSQFPVSPGIDSGSNMAVPAGLLTDIEGNPRFVDEPSKYDTGEGTAPIVDMGPYEAPFQQGTILNVVDPVIVPEEGTTEFTVRLAVDPGEPIDVTMTYVSGDTDITIDSPVPTVLSFDSSNWDQTQTIRLAAAKDLGWGNGSTVFHITSPTIWTRPLTAREDDNDVLPAVIYVDEHATGFNTGTSWQDAYTELSEALADSATRPGTPEFWIAQGEYRTGPAGSDRSATFRLADDQALYGGFEGWTSSTYPGGETLRSQRNWKANETVLSGDILDDDQPGYSSDNHTHDENSANVVLAHNVNSSAVLDGFTIRDGYANLLDPYNGGGGVRIYNASPVIRNCTFQLNYAEEGGGVACYAASSPTLINCVFDSCVAGVSTGGAIHAENSSTLDVQNCMFVGCTSWSYGGGINIVDQCTADVVNCLFTGNRSGALYGGGVKAGSGCTLNVVNSTFSRNFGSVGGGGVSVDSALETNLTNCIFWENYNNEGTTEDAQIAREAGNAPVINYCCVQAWTGAYGGVGNIWSDPRFIHPLGPDNEEGTMDDDCRLVGGSPCIDTGDSAAVPAGVTTDLAGNSRFINGLAGSGAGTVDMGAYEYLRDASIYYAISRRTHGAVGDFDIDLLSPLTIQDDTVECRYGGPEHIEIAFQELIQGFGGAPLTPADVALASTGPSAGTVTNVAVDENVLIIEMNGTSDASRLTITFPGVYNLADEPFDTAELCFHVLRGDIDGNSVVNIFDLLNIRNRLIYPVNADTFRNDPDCTGTFSIFDLLLTRNNMSQYVSDSCGG